MCPDIEKALHCYQMLLAHGAPENAKDAVCIFLKHSLIALLILSNVDWKHGQRLS
jgi:hypothetical protein